MGRCAILIDKPKFDEGVLPNGLDIFFGGPTGLFSKALRDCATRTNVAAMKAQNMDSDVIWKQITNIVVRLAKRNAEGQCRLLARYGIDYLQGSAQLLKEDDEANVLASILFKDGLDNPEDGIRSVRVSKYVIASVPTRGFIRSVRLSSTNLNYDPDSDSGSEADDYSDVLVSGTKVPVHTRTFVPDDYSDVLVSGTKVLVCTGSKSTRLR